ncbi:MULTISPECIES: TrkA family potassium uptake protein [unclassified Streptomyces]|uniref:potassium channel family protein n=1 Tax=unclassified Streptomyces TaxID=2593676 RepID=UPI002DD870B5|nr:TrkA family potassium uptake protein [Streptomyces sp. NBC_01750]WSB03693.1 TrkA family potassium uptake protein [Streptomyces sp. NBC_01794]WSD32019.1 TrkA family potassium uptake protein [Streptomyces sp. NBC_01750]
MKALIVGAGRLGTQIAQVLAAAGNDVTVVDADADRINALQGQLAVHLMLGDACEPAVLDQAGAHTADLVIAATGKDEDNLVISLLAKRQCAAPRVVARINDAENAWLFDQRWGVDIAVPVATPLISLIEEATGATDTVALLRLSKAGVDIIETVITTRSRAVGKPLSDIPLPDGTVVATVIRDGRPTVPGPAVRLQPGDALLLVSHSATEQEIHAAFQ